MDAKFMRGPWTMNDFGEIYGPDGEQILVSGVAVPCGNHSKADEAKANGQLFFASPAMLEALEAVEWTGEETWDDVQEAFVGTCPSCGSQRGDRHHSFCLLNNALRAARGER